jgi:hypothetical protein
MANWTEGRDKVSEVAFKPRPNELGKSPLWRSKQFLITLETFQNLRESYLVGSVFSEWTMFIQFHVTHLTFQKGIKLSKS